jgi:group I intron endonuclease
MGIIYKVTNKINGKVYIGQTIQSLEQRKSEHKSDAFVRNRGCYFHNALRKYRWNSFEWMVIDESDDINKLNELEKKYIKKYDSINKNFGYNLTEGGLNSKPNNITRQKISETSMGKNKGRVPWNKGKELTLECKKKMSEGLQKKKRGLFGFIGTTYRRKALWPWKKTWAANIQYNHKKHFLGSFNDPLSAQIVYFFVFNEIYGGED